MRTCGDKFNANVVSYDLSLCTANEEQGWDVSMSIGESWDSPLNMIGKTDRLEVGGWTLARSVVPGDKNPDTKAEGTMKIVEVPRAIG
jgi:hypothetical protein